MKKLVNLFGTVQDACVALIFGVASFAIISFYIMLLITIFSGLI
jgi:hypothetical protein